MFHFPTQTIGHGTQTKPQPIQIDTCGRHPLDWHLTAHAIINYEFIEHLPLPTILVPASESHFSFTSQPAVVARSWNSPSKLVDGWFRETESFILMKVAPTWATAQLIRSKHNRLVVFCGCCCDIESSTWEKSASLLGWMGHREQNRWAKLISSRDVNSGLISFVWGPTRAVRSSNHVWEVCRLSEGKHLGDWKLIGGKNVVNL